MSPKNDDAMKPEDVTFVKNAIHRPDEPRHFMRVKQPGKLVEAKINDKVVARSNQALKMQEAGFDLYDPVYYFYGTDVEISLLQPSDLSTHCPLKGDTKYYHLTVNGQTYENAAFCYAYPNMDNTEFLKEYMAFDQSQVQVTEYF